MEAQRYPVVIAGGGVVGLTASLFLAQQGVKTLLVERHPGTSIHPRARGLNLRSMELLRGLGLEAQVRRAGEAIGASFGIHTGRTLVEVMEAKPQDGWWMKRMRQRGREGRISSRSPTGPCRITQDLLEPLLLQAARERGVEARFFTGLVDLRPDASGVTCILEDRKTGARGEVRADYLIAADGAKGRIREQLGIAAEGPGALTHQLNIYFRADLTKLVKGKEFSMCTVENPQVRGLFASVNNTDLWVLHVSYDPAKGEKPEDFTPERVIHLVRSAVGIPDLAVEVKGAMPWQSTVRVAKHFRSGRVFLAGDAAHVMPPWGGFGANTGIQDSHNLAWKLAAVLKGQAGEALLETYETERQPVARTVSALALGMNDERGLMTGKKTLQLLWNMRKLFPYFVVGYGYTSSAVANEPGALPGPGTRELSGRPGTRVPHLWLTRGQARISTLDCLQGRFVAFLGGEARAWREQLQAVSGRLGLTVDLIQMGAEVSPEGSWHRAVGVTPRGVVLVRPDGMVAWRSKSAPTDRGETLSNLFERILGRSGAHLQSTVAISTPPAPAQPLGAAGRA